MDLQNQSQAGTAPAEPRGIEVIHNGLENAINVLADKVGAIEEFLTRTTGINTAPREVETKEAADNGALGGIARLGERFDGLNGRLIDAVNALERIG